MSRHCESMATEAAVTPACCAWKGPAVTVPCPVGPVAACARASPMSKCATPQLPFGSPCRRSAARGGVHVRMCVCTCRRGGASRGRICYTKRASISALDIGILSHASSFIRIPGTNKIRGYGSNLQLVKFERWLRWSVQIFFKYVRVRHAPCCVCLQLQST